MSEGITTFRAENTAHLDRRTHSSGSVQRTGRAPLGCRMWRAGTLGRRSRSLSRRGLRSWASGDRTGCSRTRMLTTRLCLGAQTLTQKPTWPNRHRRTAFETDNSRSVLAAGTAESAPQPTFLAAQTSGRLGWKPDIRTRFLRELSDVPTSPPAAARKSGIVLKNSVAQPLPAILEARQPFLRLFIALLGGKTNQSLAHSLTSDFFQQYPGFLQTTRSHMRARVSAAVALFYGSAVQKSPSTLRGQMGDNPRLT